MDNQMLTIFQKHQILRQIYAQHLVLVIHHTLFARISYIMRGTFWKLRWNKVRVYLGERLNKSISQMYSNVLMVHLFQLQKSFVKIRLKTLSHNGKECKSKIKILVLNKLPHLKNQIIQNNTQVLQLQRVLLKLHFHPREVVKFFVIWQNRVNKKNLNNILNYFEKENEKSDFALKRQMIGVMVNNIAKRVCIKKADAMDKFAKIIPMKCQALQRVLGRSRVEVIKNCDERDLLILGWSRMLKATLHEQEVEVKRQEWISWVYFRVVRKMRVAWQKWSGLGKRVAEAKEHSARRLCGLVRVRVATSKRSVFNVLRMQHHYMRCNIEVIKKLLQLKFLKKVQFRTVSQAFILMKRHNQNVSVYYSSNQSQEQRNTLMVLKNSLASVQRCVVQCLKESFTRVFVYSHNYYQRDYELQREINQNHVITLSIVSNSLHAKFQQMDVRFIDKKRKYLVGKQLRRKMYQGLKEAREAFAVWKCCIVKYSMKERLFLLRQNQRIENEKQQLVQKFEQLQNENQELQSVYQQIHTTHNTPSVRSNRKIVSFDNNVDQFNLNSDLLEADQAKQEEYSLHYVESIENQNIQLKNHLESQSILKKQLKMEFDRKQKQLQQSSNFQLQVFALQSNDLYGGD